jgi:hypothetical protein
MTKSYSYFSRLKPQKRKVEAHKAPRPYVVAKQTELVPTQPELVLAFSAIGPTAEF